jgi:hypothetical protein
MKAESWVFGAEGFLCRNNIHEAQLTIPSNHFQLLTICKSASENYQCSPISPTLFPHCMEKEGAKTAK